MTVPGAPGRRRWDRPRRSRRGPAPRQVPAGLGAVLLALGAGVIAAARARPTPPAGPGGTVVLVAARDLAAGTVPAPGDLRQARLPAAAVPADALGAGGAPLLPLGVALRRGDLLTRRDVGDRPPAPGLRGFALAVGDGVEAGPLARGDRVDVLAASGGGAARLLAGVPVLRVVPGDQGRAALVVLGVTVEGAEALAAARATRSITLVQAPPGEPAPAPPAPG